MLERIRIQKDVHHVIIYKLSRMNRNRLDDALTIVREREHSFWLDRDVGRRAQWEACRRMAELGRVAASVHAAGCGVSAPAGHHAGVDPAGTGADRPGAGHTTATARADSASRGRSPPAFVNV